ncbi:MAG: hypothetical protein CME62_14660 [Halobacteriovoraceae bacterium]|nr:hypothetical protein [Halobacteriovoraceae bacterium]|tara:strand:+ start:670 stop:966 length:297 start_codon:yes stop_codon:yes gene_type:complete
MKKVVWVLILLAPSCFACELSEKELKEKLKKEVYSTIRNTYRAFIRYEVDGITSLSSNSFTAKLSLKQTRCKTVDFHLDVDANCNISTNVQQIDGCLE